MENKDIVMITGGCGIPPIAALTEYIIKNRKKFGNVHLLYGARTPEDILMKDNLKKWEKQINVMVTIDKPFEGWTGPVGFVSELLAKIQIDPAKTTVTACGPGPMVKSLEKILKPMGVPDRRFFVSEERKMQCGIGKCQHCTTGDKYVCLNGPVFNIDEIDKNWD